MQSNQSFPLTFIHSVTMDQAYAISMNSFGQRDRFRGKDGPFCNRFKQWITWDSQEQTELQEKAKGKIANRCIQEQFLIYPSHIQRFCYHLILNPEGDPKSTLRHFSAMNPFWISHSSFFCHLFQGKRFLFFLLMLADWVLLKLRLFYSSYSSRHFRLFAFLSFLFFLSLYFSFLIFQIPNPLLEQLSYFQLKPFPRTYFLSFFSSFLPLNP